MSDKIEEYKKAKAVAVNVKEQIKCALGLDSPSNDKHRLKLAFNGDERFASYGAPLHLESIYGYYGSSTACQALGRHSAEYLLKAINARMSELALDAVRIAEAEAQKLLDEAKKEAEEVLKTASALEAEKNPHDRHNEARPCSQCGEV